MGEWISKLLLVLLLSAGVTLALVCRDRLSLTAPDDWLCGAGKLAALLYLSCNALAAVLFGSHLLPRRHGTDA